MPSELFSVLESMNNGRALAKIENAFEEVRNAVVDVEGSGEINIKLKVSHGKKNLNKVLDMSTVATAGTGERKIAIPQEITIILAPFEGQDAQLISAFLRFRPGKEGVVFQYELQRPEEAIRKSAEEARTRVAMRTGQLVLNGTL